MKYKHHYTYRITNITLVTLKKYYYGCRSCNINPKDDLSFIYFSTSTDKNFIKDQQENPQNYKYKIIKIFKTREEAIELEIKLHNKFNVGINELFFNKAKQTSTGFDTTGKTAWNKGKPHSNETRKKIKNAKQNISDYTRQKMSESHKGCKHHAFGTRFSKEHKEKMSKSMKGVTRSDETKIKMSIAQTGKTTSEETKIKMSIAQTGKTTSEETKIKMSIAAKNRSKENKKKLSAGARNRKRVKCTHCDKIGDISAMKRWHFDNCKYKN